MRRVSQPDPASLPTEHEVQTFYDQAYQRHGLADSLHHYRWIVRLLRPVPGSRLLDVACGEGHLLAAAHRAQLAAAGIDLSAEAVRRAAARCPQAALCVANGEALPFPDGAFDYLTCLGSLEHYREMAQGLREMARVLKPDGVACLMLPNAFWLGDVLEVLWRGQCSSLSQIIERHGTRGGWQQLLAAHGFTVERTCGYNRTYPLFVRGTWKVKSLRKFLWRRLFNWLTPKNLSLELVFVCRLRPG